MAHKPGCSSGLPGDILIKLMPLSHPRPITSESRVSVVFFQLPDNSIMQPNLRTRDPAGDWSSPGKTRPSVADGAGLQWGQRTLYFYHDPR